MGRVDIARMNLLCARGLPGTEQLDVDECLATLDKWAARAASETERFFYKFRQTPSDYEYSEAYYRMLTLATVLQQDFGVHYSYEQLRKVDFTRSEDLFIHGLTGHKRSGTCVSMPVLYVAVGRRLGYPLKLVLAKTHVFARWEDPDTSERFNIEATDTGLNCPPDDHYRTWPVKISDAELEAGRYLKSLSPPEELAVFLAMRGHCLLDTGRRDEAREAYAQAVRFAPDVAEYRWFLADVSTQEPGTPRLTPEQELKKDAAD